MDKDSKQQFGFSKLGSAIISILAIAGIIYVLFTAFHK